MLTHPALWAAIDRLAQRHGLSVSGLAKRAGLDPTTFNPSKRTGRDGKPRWPSTESLAKVLGVTDTLPEHFLPECLLEETLFEESPPTPNSPRLVPKGRDMIPAARFGQTRQNPLFDENGFPQGDAWDEVLFSDPVDPSPLYALDMDDHTFAPIYRYGDRLILSPTADIRVGDRLVVCTAPCTLHIGELLRITARYWDIRVISPAPNANETQPQATNYGKDGDILTLDHTMGHWCARILWVRH